MLVVSCSHRNSGTYVFGLPGPGDHTRLGTFYTVPKSSRNFLPPLVLHKWEQPRPQLFLSIIGFVFSPELNAPPILLYLNLSFVVDVFCRSSSLPPLMILVTVLVNPQDGIPIRKAVITLRSRLLSFIRNTWSEYFLNYYDYLLFQFHVIMPFIFILFASSHTLDF